MQFEDLTTGITQIGKMSHAWAKGGSSLGNPDLHNLTDMILFSPLGMFTALFRPLPGEVNNAFGLIAGLENVGLLYYFGRALWRTKLKGITGNQRWAFAISLIIIWSFSYGFISYQNLGTAVRFKLQILAIMLIFIQSVLNGTDAKPCAG